MTNNISSKFCSYLLIAFLVIFPGVFVSCGRHPDNIKITGSPAADKESARIISEVSEGWKFEPDIRDIGEKNGWYREDFDRSGWAGVKVPQAWDCYETALRGYEGTGWYTITINPDQIKTGRHTDIVFNRVMYYSKVWINGQYIGENIGGYLPFRFDISGYVKPGQKTKVVLRVDNKPRIEWLPAAAQIEWMQYGGILQKVQLVTRSHTYIDDLTVRTDLQDGKALLNCSARVINETDDAVDMELALEISGGSSGFNKSVKFHSNAKDTTLCHIELIIDHPELWSPEKPSLYTVKAVLRKNGEVSDNVSDRIGIRKISIDGNSILLNGKPVTIRGVNRYDEYGSFGVNAPEELLRKELALMKSVGINTIRVHYPQSPDLLSLYDEYGFMMLEEVPLNWWGQSWWGEKVKMSPDILDQAKPALRKMIARDKNHPCVIIWSMGNECMTNTEVGIQVMRELLKLAKSLDPTRPVTFVVALDPTGHLAYSDADIVCINKYNGSLAGKLCDQISQIDSLGYQPMVKELQNHRSSIVNKPIIITEYGTQGIKNIHGDVPYSEEFQAAYIEKAWDAIKSVPGISGGILWCWADYYHRKYLITYNDYGPYGVVTVDRQPKKSLQALARMYGGSLK